jgi:hypothetical protein
MKHDPDGLAEAYGTMTRTIIKIDGEFFRTGAGARCRGIDS